MARAIERYTPSRFSTLKPGTELDVVLLNGSSYHGKLLNVENNQFVSLKISRQKVKFPIEEINEIIVSVKV